MAEAEDVVFVENASSGVNAVILARARSHYRFALLLVRFIPDLLPYSVPLFLKRQCDRTL
jgi:hypothetical protein